MNENIRKEAQAFVDAAIAASTQLAEAKVPHCLVGRLALMSHGHGGGDPIDEVTFLVDKEAAFMSIASSKVLVVKAALPVAVGDIKVKWCCFEEAWEEAAWAGELVMPKKDGDVPVASLPVVLCLMMMSDDSFDEDLVVDAVMDGGAPMEEAVETLSRWKPDLAAFIKKRMS